MDLDQIENTSEENKLDSLPDLEDGVYYDVDKEDTDTNNNDNNENELEIDNNDNNDNTVIEDIDPNYEDEKEIIKDEEQIEEQDEVNDLEIQDTQDNADADNKSNPIIIDLGDTQIEVNSPEELKQIAETSVKDKAKFDKYKNDIAIVEGLKEQGVEEEDLYLLAEAKKGNTKAIAKLLKKANVDPLDLDLDDNEITDYKPNEVKADMEYIEAKSILENIQKDPQVATKFDNLVMKEFNEEARQTVFKDSNNLQFIAELTKTGLLDQLLPDYTKMKLLGEPGSQFDLLVKAYDNFITKTTNAQNQKIEETKTNIEQSTQTKTNKRKKMSAGSKTKNTPPKKEKSINEMTDAEFEAYYKKVSGVDGFVVD